ncbi:MAG: lysophospholipid acyltransferase family protein [Gammaproteobacteria bacterium]
MVLLRSVLFYIGLSIATLIFTPLGVFLFPLPFQLRFRIMSRWSAFNLWSLRIACGLSHEVLGAENIPDQAAIIMCKHQSAWETLALQLVFPPQAWVLKRELLWIPIYGWGLASMEPIAIDRGSTTRALRQIVRQGRQRLDAGIWVVVFPEGTRVAPGERREYQPGGGMLAAQSGRPVVPVAHNAGYFWPRRSLRKLPGKITMVIGPPIESTGRSAAEITRLAEKWIEDTASRLPAPHPLGKL